MNLKIKTKDIELEYSDEYAIIEENAKKRIIEMLDRVFEKQTMLEVSKPIPNPYYTPTTQPIVGTVDEIFNAKK